MPQIFLEYTSNTKEATEEKILQTADLAAIFDLDPFFGSIPKSKSVHPLVTMIILSKCNKN